MGCNFVAGFGDQQCAVLIEEADRADLILLGHHGHGLADQTIGLVDQIVQKIVDIVRNACGGLLIGDRGGQQME